MHYLGLKGMTRRVYTYLPEQGWGGLNLLATVGALEAAHGDAFLVQPILGLVVTATHGPALPP